MTTDAISESWREGVRLFNEGAFWHAHEKFEKGWLTLPPLEKLYLQVLIQTCALFYHLKKGRFKPAKNLCAAIIAKLTRLQESPAWSDSFKPRPQIDDLLKTIEDVYRQLNLGEKPPPCNVRARWLIYNEPGFRL